MKKLLACAVLAVCAVSASAEDLSASPSICAGVSDDRARLACYDGLAARAKAAAPATAVSAPAAASAPMAAPAAAPIAAPVPPSKPFVSVPQPAPAAAAPAPKAEGFGAETIRKAPEKVAEEAAATNEELHATVTAVSFSPLNKFIVTLDNGLVWRQNDSDAGKAKFHKSGDKVTISHGLLGSYNLVVDRNDYVLYKVRRVK